MLINANRIINKKKKYNKSLDENLAIKRLNILCFTKKEKELENYLALVSSIIDNDNLLKNNRIKEDMKKIENMTELKEIINNEVLNIIKNFINEEKIRDINDYIESQILPYYKGNFTIRKSREISLLPIELRLLVYLCLLNNENDLLTSLNYCDRLSLTLAKLGYKDLASIIVGYSWVLNWGKIRCGDNNRAFKIDIDSINNIKLLRSKILSQNNIKPEERLDELNYSLGTFSNKNIIHDINSAKIIVPLLKIYYYDIPDIEVCVDNIVKFLDDKKQDSLANIEKIKLKESTTYKVYSIDGNNNEIESVDINVNNENVLEKNDINTEVNEKKENESCNKIKKLEKKVDIEKNIEELNKICNLIKKSGSNSIYLQPNLIAQMYMELSSMLIPIFLFKDNYGLRDNEIIELYEKSFYKIKRTLDPYLRSSLYWY